MGRVRRGGYIFEWWIGDLQPRHVHVFDQHGELLGRVNLQTYDALEDNWTPPKKVIKLIQELQSEERL